MYRYDVVFRRPSDPAAVDAAADSPKRSAARGTSSSRGTPRSTRSPRSSAGSSRRRPTTSLVGLADARLVYEEALVDELDENTRDARVHATAGALRAYLDARAARLGRSAVEPEDIYRLGERLGYRVNAMWTPDEPAKFDVVFAKTSAPEPEPVAFASLRRGGSQRAPREMADEKDSEDAANALRELTNKGAGATSRASNALADLLGDKKAAAAAAAAEKSEVFRRPPRFRSSRRVRRGPFASRSRAFPRT